MTSALESFLAPTLKFYTWAKEQHIRVKRFKIDQATFLAITNGNPPGDKEFLRIDDIPVVVR